MQINTVTPTKQLIKISEVIHRTAKSRSSIYLGVSRQSFPAPHKIGDRAVAWLASDIDAWIDAQTAKVEA
jgi:prophage regulatory protein